MSCVVTEQYTDMLSKWLPVRESNIIDEAMQSQSFQPQIMCLSAGSPSLVFDDSVEGCSGCSYPGLQTTSTMRQKAPSSCCVGK